MSPFGQPIVAISSNLDEFFIASGLHKTFGSGGIRTHASEETGALNQRLRPLGHATLLAAHCTCENYG